MCVNFMQYFAVYAFVIKNLKIAADLVIDENCCFEQFMVNKPAPTDAHCRDKNLAMF